jgi:hypothetical protein
LLAALAHHAGIQQCSWSLVMHHSSLDTVLSRVIRESGSWSVAERRIRMDHGAAVVGLAAAIALRERGQSWLRGERPAWAVTRST